MHYISLYFIQRCTMEKEKKPLRYELFMNKEWENEAGVQSKIWANLWRNVYVSCFMWFYDVSSVIHCVFGARKSCSRRSLSWMLWNEFIKLWWWLHTVNFLNFNWYHESQRAPFLLKLNMRLPICIIHCWIVMMAFILFNVY